MAARPLAACLVAALSACASAPDPGVRASLPHPALADSVERGEEVIPGEGGVQLFAQWVRPRGEPRAVLVAHHGLKDHSDRYLPFAQKLAAAGIAFYAYDMRGHGRSSGPRVTMPSADALVDDLEHFVARVRAREPGRPLFVMGHSVGGMVTALYAVERHPDVAGVILLAPAIAFSDSPAQIPALRTLAVLLPRAPLLDNPTRYFSRDDAVVAEMDADPLIDHVKGPALTALMVLDGTRRIWAGVEHVTAPLLVIHGTPDRLTAPSGSRDFVERAGSADRTLRILPGVHHDLMHEPEGPQVQADIIAWISARTGGPVPGVVMPPRTRLLGDRAPAASSFELDVRGEHPTDDGDLGVTGGFRDRMTFGGPVGFVVGLDARAGSAGRAVYQADLHAAGLALRLGRAGQISVTGGIGLEGAPFATHLPVEVDLQLSTPIARLIARGALAWRLSGADLADEALGIADEASALLAVRLGGDLPYWARVSAGRGLYLGVTYRNVGGETLWGAALGLDLWSSW